jgi:hypothetical protein
MTSLLIKSFAVVQTEVSSRPERSVVEGPAVHPPQYRIRMEASPSPLSSRAYPDFLLHRSHGDHLCGSHMLSTEAATLDRKSGGAEGSAVPRTRLGNVFLSEESPASAPPKMMKPRAVQQLLSMEAPPSPLSSRAKPRDLRFNGTFVEMFAAHRTTPRTPQGKSS